MLVSSKSHYSIYIVTNPQRKVLYTDVTNDLAQGLIEHWGIEEILKHLQANIFVSI